MCIHDSKFTTRFENQSVITQRSICNTYAGWRVQYITKTTCPSRSNFGTRNRDTKLQN